jgi:hypothetical protein
LAVAVDAPLAAAQEFPHAPQLLRSVLRFTHELEHRVNPEGHGGGGKTEAKMLMPPTGGNPGGEVAEAQVAYI